MSKEKVYRDVHGNVYDEVPEGFRVVKNFSTEITPDIDYTTPISRDPEYRDKSDISVAENAQNKLTKALELINPIQPIKDIVSYTKNYNSDRYFKYPVELFKQLTSNQLDRLSNGLSFFNLVSPSQYVGAVREVPTKGFSFRRFGNSVLNGNTGLFSEQYAQKHPYLTMLGNMGFDVFTSAPKAVIESGASLLKGVGRNITPPSSPALAVVNNGVFPVVSSVDNTSTALNQFGIYTIPSVRQAGNSFMAFENSRANKDFDPKVRTDKKGPQMRSASIFQNIEDLSDDQYNFLLKLIEKSRIDLSGIDLRKVYRRIPSRGEDSFSRIIDSKHVKGFQKYFGANEDEVVGLGTTPNSRTDFGHFLYRLAKWHHGKKGRGTPLEWETPFRNLGVDFKNLNEPMDLVRDGRALAADIKGQLFQSGELGIEDLVDGQFMLYPDEDLLPNLLTTAHGGALVDGARSAAVIKGFKRVTEKNSGKKKFVWEQELPEPGDPNRAKVLAERQKIIDAWNKVMYQLKNGGKLLSKQSNK